MAQTAEELRRKIKEEFERRQQEQAEPKTRERRSEPRRQPEDGPLGIIDEGLRSRVRGTIEALSGLAQFAREEGIPTQFMRRPGGGVDASSVASRGIVGGGMEVARMGVEAAPATLGSALGVAAGSAGGPAGMTAGASLGGLAGEAIGQETGLTPRSDAGLALSAAAPFIGSGVTAGLRGARRGISAAVESLPAARAAMGRTAARQGAAELESIGGRILASRRGAMARSADDIFAAARRSGIHIPAGEMRSTLKTLRNLNDELEPFNAFPEVQTAMKMGDRLLNTIAKNQPLSFDEIIRTRVLLGDAVRRAERAGGIKSSTADRLFASFANDIDRIAKSTTHPARREARLAKVGFQRAKLELSVRDLEHGVAQHIKEIPGDTSAVTLNVSGMRNWLRKTTNPKSKQYNKNMADALKDDLPAIRKRLAELDALTQEMNPGGRGSIVVRGITAAGGAGAGFAIAGAPGAMVGSLMGASGPEAMTAILMSPRASQLLQRAVRMGRGTIPHERWIISTQAAVQALSNQSVPELEPEQRGAAQ